MIRNFLFWAALAVAVPLGCSAPENQSAGTAAESAAPPMAEPARDEGEAKEADAAEPGGSPREGSPAPAPESVAPAPNRLIVYHADLRVKVAEMPAATAALEKAVQAAGGWTSGLTETREDGRWQQQTTIRVAPGRFGRLLKSLSALGTVESKTLNTADVTAEHADVTARLAAKRALEQEYLRLLKQAKKVSELLEVQEKIGEVREEIESTEAHLKKLNDEVGYSTITVALYQPLALETPDAPVVSFGARLVEAVFDGWQVLVGLVLGAVTVWPLWLLGAGGWWLWKRRRKG